MGKKIDERQSGKIRVTLILTDEDWLSIVCSNSKKNSCHDIMGIDQDVNPGLIAEILDRDSVDDVMSVCLKSYVDALWQEAAELDDWYEQFIPQPEYEYAE